ncbi:MAG: hypothetical protein ACYTAN_06515 [Planctomycetota bacterium]|jgi:acyl-CoA reductase-like NAD-dependent aldehyde dehydrogenase
MAKKLQALNHVDGEWCRPEGAGEIRPVNPADTREEVSVAPDSPASEVDRALAAADHAFAAVTKGE